VIRQSIETVGIDRVIVQGSHPGMSLGDTASCGLSWQKKVQVCSKPTMQLSAKMVAKT